MAKHVKIGDRLEVVFERAPRGVQSTQPINGRPAYAIDSGPAPLIGDRWEVMVVAINRARTAYFVEPLHLVEAADGLSSVLAPYQPFYHEFIRAAEARVKAVLSDFYNSTAIGAVVEASGDGEFNEEPEDKVFDAMEEIQDHLLLPEAYKADVLSRMGANLTGLFVSSSLS